jgi:hypothetical protein
MVSIRRYQLISALFDRTKLQKEQLFNAEFCWLLSETSLFRESLNNPITKYQAYDNTKKYCDMLNSLEIELKADESLSTTTRIKLFHQAIDVIGHATAKTDADFDTLYWRPYISARRRWASQRQNDKSLITVLPNNKAPKDNRGRKLGSKNKRELP